MTFFILAVGQITVCTRALIKIQPKLCAIHSAPQNRHIDLSLKMNISKTKLQNKKKVLEMFWIKTNTTKKSE